MVIDQRFGRGVVIQEAFNDAWSSFYGQAVQENHLSPLAQPDLEVTKLEDGDLIEFTAEVDVRPDFELPDFAGLEATVEPLEVPDALVDKQVEALQQRFGSRETVERPAAEGDVVTISLAASRDGEPLPDATADDLDYTIGSGTMLDGLDEAVTGLSAGESATFSSTLVGGARSGEEADIEVTVSKVQEQELPAADDELAQQASEFDTIEELRADISRAADPGGPARAGQPGSRRRPADPARPAGHRGARQPAGQRAQGAPRADHQPARPGRARPSTSTWSTPARTRPRTSSGSRSRSGRPRRSRRRWCWTRWPRTGRSASTRTT